MITSSHIELRDILKTLIFPSNKQNLILQAKKHGATCEVINDLQNLPDKEYTCQEDVFKELESK